MGGIQHRVAWDAFEFLGQIADAQPRALADAAVVEALLAEDQSQERRLADAVRPDQADARARAKMRGRILQQHFGGELFGDRFEL